MAKSSIDQENSQIAKSSIDPEQHSQIAKSSTDQEV